MKYLFEDEIETVALICPYCGDNAYGKIGCCGESSAHFEEHYVTTSDCIFSTHEYIAVYRLPVGASNVCLSD